MDSVGEGEGGEIWENGIETCIISHSLGLPQWLSSKESACNAGDAGFIPGSGRSPGGGHGNPCPVQYSRLENPMDRGAWRATVRGVPKSQTQLKRLSTYACTHARTIHSLVETRPRSLTSCGSLGSLG